MGGRISNKRLGVGFITSLPYANSKSLEVGYGYAQPIGKTRAEKRQRRLRVAEVLISLLIFVLSIALAVIAISMTWDSPESEAQEPAAPPDIILNVAGILEEELQPLIAGFQSERPDICLRLEKQHCNAMINALPTILAQTYQKEIFCLPQLLLKTGERENILRPAWGCWLCSSLEDDRIADLASYLESGLSTALKPTIMNIVGNIIPGRNVARRMAERGTLYPFERVAPYINSADIVFADLECPLSDRFNPPYNGVNFIAPQETISGLDACGVNIVSLANNHSTNFGLQAFTDTIDLLESHGIDYVGGGRNAGQAYAPTFVETEGCRFAFLRYNAIAGSINASQDMAGVAWFDMSPYAADDLQDIASMEEAVKRARQEADFVIVGFHWSVEYVDDPSLSMTNAAHAACDAGADMVIGSHPHMMQPIEFYRGSLITYNLGNFIFDQMWAEYTREGVILRCKMLGSYVTEIEVLPYRICDYCQPVVMEQGSGQYLLDRLLNISHISAN